VHPGYAAADCPGTAILDGLHPDNLDGRIEHRKQRLVCLDMHFQLVTRLQLLVSMEQHAASTQIFAICPELVTTTGGLQTDLTVNRYPNKITFFIVTTLIQTHARLLHLADIMINKAGACAQAVPAPHFR